MQIKIPKKEVFSEVEKRSSLEGYLLSDKYDSVWASENKGVLLESYWIEGCGAVVQILKDFLNGNTDNVNLLSYNASEELTLDVSLSGRYNQYLVGSMTTGIKMMIACNILSRWLGVCSPDLSPKYDEEAKSYLEDIRIKLFTRIAPSRTFVSAKADEESVIRDESCLGFSPYDEIITRSEEPLSQGVTDNEVLKHRKSCF